MDHGSSHVSPGQIPCEWMSYMEILSIDAYVKEKKKTKNSVDINFPRLRKYLSENYAL